jgi:hypothetical protein
MTSTPDAEAAVRAFLDTYDAVTRSDDLSPLRELFAPSFVAGSPAGASVVTVDMMIAAATARRRRTVRLGHEGAHLTHVDTVWLGPSYCLVSATWDLTFRPPGRDPVTFVALSDFLLSMATHGPRALAYLARQDLDAELARLEAG